MKTVSEGVNMSDWDEVERTLEDLVDYQRQRLFVLGRNLYPI